MPCPDALGGRTQPRVSGGIWSTEPPEAGLHALLRLLLTAGTVPRAFRYAALLLLRVILRVCQRPQGGGRAVPHGPQLGSLPTPSTCKNNPAAPPREMAGPPGLAATSLPCLPAADAPSAPHTGGRRPHARPQSSHLTRGENSD